MPLQESDLCSCDYDGVRLCHLLPAEGCQLERQQESGLGLAFSGNCRYYLARASGPMSVDLIDGCHGSPAGVAEAAKLHLRIFNDKGPWVMVELHDVPDMEVEIDEDAARVCAHLVMEGTPDA